MATKPEIDIILDLLKEVREDQKEHGKELSKQSAYLTSMDADIKEMKPIVSKNTDDIFYHIRRTDLLEQLHKDNQKKIALSEQRIAKLEEPVKAKEWLKKHIIAVSAVITAIISIVAALLKQ
jgi:hypothetical protein